MNSMPLSDGIEQPSNRERKFHFWRCFWLTFLVVSLAYAWYCFYVPSNQIAWAANFNTAQKQSIETGKPMVLYFTGKWCVPCRIMKRQVWADKEVATSVNSQFIPVAIDLDSLEDAEVVARYNIRGTPVTIITDSQGNTLRWRAGGMAKSEFVAFLNEPNSAMKTEK
jgi:protein disulfide-isomerase